MDHSVQGYLSRQPTQVLQVLLRDYSSADNLENYFRVIPIIMEILTARNAPIPQEIQTRIAEYQNKEK